MPYDPVLDGEAAYLDRAHEAGHAVVSIIEGHRFKRIVMQPTGYRSNAHIEAFRFPGADSHPFGFAPEDVATSPVARDRLRRQLHILLAGGEADRHALPGHTQNTDSLDVEKAHALLAQARSADPSLPADLDVYAEETRQLVAAYYPAIEEVATALRQQPELSYEDVCALVLPEAAALEYEPNGWRAAGRDTPIPEPDL